MPEGIPPAIDYYGVMGGWNKFDSQINYCNVEASQSADNLVCFLAISSHKSLEKRFFLGNCSSTTRIGADRNFKKSNRN